MNDTYICLICDARFIGDKDWREHLKSKSHGAARVDWSARELIDRPQPVRVEHTGD